MSNALSYLFSTIISVFSNLFSFILTPITNYIQSLNIPVFLELNSNYEILGNFFTGTNLGWFWNFIQFAYDLLFIPDGIFEMLIYYIIIKNIIILSNNAVKIFLQWYDTLKF